MSFNTYPSNPFPQSTDRMDDDTLEAEVNQLKSGLTYFQGIIKAVNSNANTKKILRITVTYGKQPVIIALENNGVNRAFGMVTIYNGFWGYGAPEITIDGTNNTIDIVLEKYSGDILMISTRDFTYTIVDIN